MNGDDHRAQAANAATHQHSRRPRLGPTPHMRLWAETHHKRQESTPQRGAYSGGRPARMSLLVQPYPLLSLTCATPPRGRACYIREAERRERTSWG